MGQRLRFGPKGQHSKAQAGGLGVRTMIIDQPQRATP